MYMKYLMDSSIVIAQLLNEQSLGKTFEFSE